MAKYRCTKETRHESPHSLYISSSSELTSQTFLGPPVFVDDTTRALAAVLVGAFLLVPTELADGVFSSFEFESPSEGFASFLAFFLVEDTMISFRHNCHMWLSILQHLQSFLQTRASRKVCGIPLRASSSCSLVKHGVPPEQDPFELPV